MIDKLTKGKIGGLQIQSASEKADYFNMMFYGDSGIGKTLIAGEASSIAELAPVLFVDAEGGTLTIRDKYPDVDTVRVTKFSELQPVYDELYRGDTGYKTVVIDSLTEIQRYSMMGILAEKKRKSNSPDEPIADQRDWGINLEQTRQFVRAFRDLPMNVIFTALALEERDDKRGTSKIKPSLTGKAKDEIPGFLDHVLYMYILEQKGVQRRLMLASSTEKIVAKNRGDKIPTVVEEPTMNKLFAFINGEKK